MNSKKGCDILMIALIGISLLPACALAAAKKQPAPKWTVADTINSALSYSPAVKSQKENVAAAEEGVKQARAGYLPQINVQGRTGFGSLPVSKND